MVIVHAEIYDGSLCIRKTANPLQVLVFPDTLKLNVLAFLWSYLAHILYNVLSVAIFPYPSGISSAAIL